MMKRNAMIFGFLLSASFLTLTQSWAAPSPLSPENANKSTKPDALASSAPDQGVLFHPESVDSDGAVTVGGQRIDYRASAGTIIVHPKDWDDAAWREHPGKLSEEEDKEKEDKNKEKNPNDLGDR